MESSSHASTDSLDDSTAINIAADDLTATFLPAHGMLGVSLRHRGLEILRRLDDLPAAATKGSTAGLPLLHPWANRLAAARYDAAGREVTLRRDSPLLHFDGNGLPMHGVPWSKLVWKVVGQGSDHLISELDWSTPDLLAVFPFRHRLAFDARLEPSHLTVAMTLTATGGNAVPVSFGFHPYVGIPNLPRAQWRLELPPMRRLTLDGNGIPTGEETPFGGLDTELGARAFDDGFALTEETATFALSGGGYRISLQWLSGYRYAQVFSPQDQNFLAIEPMTAPANALISGQGLRLVAAGDVFTATFRIAVTSTA